MVTSLEFRDGWHQLQESTRNLFRHLFVLVTKSEFCLRQMQDSLKESSPKDKMLFPKRLSMAFPAVISALTLVSLLLRNNFFHTMKKVFPNHSIKLD